MASKKKSPIWTYFKGVVKDPRSAVCKLREIKFFFGGVGKKATTSKMLNNLRNEHSEEYQKFVPKLPEGQETTNQDTNEKSDDSTSSSLTLTKRMRTEDQSLNQTIHSNFMDCCKEVLAEKSTAHRKTAAERKAVATEMDIFLSISIISHHDNPYMWCQARKSEFPCLIKIAAKYLFAPGSTVYTERFFSEDGMVYEKKK
ncbi:hypothetical protein WA026_012726 [Henosepilachna vigintioctopunctata]|uniref:HAT C-terminal dimerisation domain-containing protein n=1 Tax=Henosepilachna vigintioctopunctata TaxID=420089 RepID=A0AAW1U6Y0_9CUCU